MFKVVLSENISSEIDSFIDGYLHGYLDLFVDSWINNVQQIIKNYEDFAFKFRDTIYDNVYSFFSNEKILWHSELENTNMEVTITIWNYRFFVEYSANLWKKLRYIEWIKIHKK